MAGSTDTTGIAITPPPFSITQATTPEDLEAVAAIFTAYTNWLGLDLAFQNYEAELAGLPGKYSPPLGALLLARDGSAADGAVLGCIALRPLDLQPEFRTGPRREARFCELKRLFTYPTARGRGVAKALVRQALAVAEHEGYQEVLLDTLASMTPAVALYKGEGFSEVERYYNNPLDNVVYMAKRLGCRDGALR